MSYATASQYLGIYKVPKSNMAIKSHTEPYVPKYNSIENYTNLKPELNMKWEKRDIQNTADPRIWGPAFWFTLHNSAAHYPIEASPLVRERMKGRILAIPYEIPCAGCRPHASAFIESRKKDLDQIVSGRHSLGQFYVDFHNKVNERYGKKQWTYDEAYNLYTGGAKVTYLKYD